jgi:myosin-5
MRGIANEWIGLQTPRLKRLAEIVSQQAIAQQEKMEFDGDDDEVNGHSGINGDGMNGMNGNGHDHDTIQEEIAA